MSQSRHYQYYPYTFKDTDDLKSLGQPYIPPHNAYLGINVEFNRKVWQEGDPLFDFSHIDKEKALKDIRSTEDVYSDRGKEGKGRSFFAHIYEGDETGGLHHRADAITPRKITFIEPSKRYVGDRGAFRIDALIDGNLKPDNIMFPDNWSRDDVLDSIIEAYINAKYLKGNLFVGEDKSGFSVKIAINNSDFTIQTAMPNY